MSFESDYKNAQGGKTQAIDLTVDTADFVLLTEETVQAVLNEVDAALDSAAALVADIYTASAGDAQIADLNSGDFSVLTSNLIDGGNIAKAPIHYLRGAIPHIHATAAPTVDDDVNVPYYPGTFWLRLSTKKLYVCTDNSAGAADWQILN